MESGHRTISLALCVSLSVLLPAASIAAQKQDPKKSAKRQQPQELGCDSSAIQWFIPGQFKEALAKAKKEKRLLMIKGISFGVDNAGAKCATKGRW